MTFFHLYTTLFAFILGGRFIYAIYYLPKVRKILRATELTSPGSSNEDLSFYILVPLLNEVTIFPKLLKRLTNAFPNRPGITIVFITTEREFETSSRALTNTVNTVSDYLSARKDNYMRHIHYPEVNSKVAQQINYAITQIQSEIEESLASTYFGFYNADSNISGLTIPALITAIAKYPDTQVFQQSSAFLSNSFKDISGLLLRANALRQTRWTFLYEIPRYIRSWPNEFSLVHVVTHGLFIRADVLEKVDNFPEDSYGEDLYLGFMLHSFGYKVRSLPILENSESPSSIPAMIRQKFVWYWGPLGYFYYWLRIKKKFPVVWSKNRLVILFTTLLGIVDALNWLLAGPAFLLFIVAGFLINSATGFACSSFVLIYFVYTCTYTFLIYSDRQNHDLFPQINLLLMISSILLYPIIVMVHGIPPVATIYKDLELRISKDVYLRPKTERA